MEYRIKRVQKQLDDLGYRQVLLPEALPLIEKLTADLIQTTESLQKYKQIAKDAIEERDNLQLGAEPYKLDNAKLVKECNDLHLAFLQFREQNEKLQKDLKRKLICCEKDKLDCNTENEKLKKKVRDLEFESAKKTDRLLASKSTLSGTKVISKSILTTNLKSKESKSNIELSMKMAEQKITGLTKEINQLKDEQRRLNEVNETYKLQIVNRDREIERLSQMLEGGRPLAALNKDSCCDPNILVNQLQNQVGLLQRDKSDLEVCLKESVGKQHEAMKRALTLADRNKQLENELRDIDQMALEVEADCNTAVKSTAIKVNRLEDKIHELLLQIQNNDREIMEVKRDKQDLMSDLEALKVEKKHLQSILETALDEKKRFADQINQFNIIEHDLNLEIDRLVQASANQKRKIAELECQLLTGRVEALSDRSVKCDGTSERLKLERDFYMKEFRRISEQGHGSITPASKTPLLQSLTEKDNLITTLQHEKKILAQEKHNLMTRLESARDSLEDGDCDGFSLKTALRKVERERDMFKADMFRLEEERDAIRHRLKATMEGHVTERVKMEKALAEADNEIRRLELERHDLIQCQGSRRGTIGHLEEQCELLKEEHKKSQTELNQFKALYSQLKTLHEQTDTALADSQAQINQLEIELSKYVPKCCDPVSNKDAEEIAALKSEIVSLKQKLIQIDKEKDSLLISLDVKTERTAVLEHDIKTKDNELSLSEETIACLKKKIRKISDDLSEKERLLRVLTSEISSVRIELEDANRTKDNALQENRRLQETLASVTADCRCSRNDIEQHKRQIEDLKRQLQTYVAEVKRFEDMINQKEFERNQLLDQFKSLSEEASALESNNHSLEHEATQSKVQLSVTLDHVNDLETKLTNQKHLVSDYEEQITDLRQQLSKMEERVKFYRQQQEETKSEMCCLKDLCTRLDKQKDHLARELQVKDDEKIKINQDMLRIRRESETLQSSLVRDRTSLENLEKLLADAREEAASQRVYNEELEHEIKQLNEKIEEFQTKLCSGTATATFSYTTGLLSNNDKSCICCKNCTSNRENKGVVIDIAGTSTSKKYTNKCLCCGKPPKLSLSERAENFIRDFQKKPIADEIKKFTLSYNAPPRSNLTIDKGERKTQFVNDHPHLEKKSCSRPNSSSRKSETKLPNSSYSYDSRK